MTTAARLTALVNADVAGATRDLRGFGDEVTRTRQKTQQDTDLIAAAFRGALGAGVLLAGAGAVLNVFRSVASGAIGVVRNLTGEALDAHVAYESLERSLTQLTATQIMQAGVTNDMAEALRLAKEPAQELVTWTERLGIKSPYTSDYVAETLRMAQAFGFSVAEAKRITQAMIDFASGTGASGEIMSRITLNLGQMAAQGKVTGREIRDLAMAGLPVKNILAEAFGVTQAKMSDMLDKGAVPVGKALDIIVSYLETNFSGAAERATNTWQGLLSSIDEIKAIDLRSLFGGMFEAVRPELASLIDFASSATFKTRLQAIGAEFGEALKAGIQTGKEAISGLIDEGLLGNLGDTLKSFANGDWASGVSELVGRIEFGVLTAIVEAKYVSTTFLAVGSYIATVLTEFISHFGQVAAQLGNVIQSRGTAIVADIQATMRLGRNAEFNAARDTADAEANLAAGNLAELVGLISDPAATAYDGMVTSLREANTEHANEIALLEQTKAKYNELNAERTRNKLNDMATGFGEVINTRTLAEDAAKAGDTVSGAVKDALSSSDTLGSLETGAADAGTSAGKAFASALKSATESAVGEIKGMLQEGVSFSQGLGKVPGLNPLEPGNNGPFEQIYQLQDVAFNLGTGHEGKDTRKFYQQFFDGQGFEEARAQAMESVRKFQLGQFYDPSVMPYIDKDKMGAYAQDLQAGKDQSTRFAREFLGGQPGLIQSLVGGDLAGDGVVLSPAQSEALAAQLKTGLVDGIGKVAGQAPTVMDALLTGATGASSDTVKSFSVVPTLASAISADMKTNAALLQTQGGAAWALLEGGMLEKAKKSNVLSAAVEAILDGLIEKYTAEK